MRWKGKADRRKMDRNLAPKKKKREGEKGRARVNEETLALIFGENFHPRFEGLKM
jgi:hypothetical protein